jgi:hypothetical protein
VAKEYLNQPASFIFNQHLNNIMNAKKENWIEKTLASADDVHRAEPNPFLYEKILSRMQSNPQAEHVISKKLLWKISIGFCLLLLVNIVSIKKFNSSQASETIYSASSTEYSFTNNYNY